MNGEQYPNLQYPDLHAPVLPQSARRPNTYTVEFAVRDFDTWGTYKHGAITDTTIIDFGPLGNMLRAGETRPFNHGGWVYESDARLWARSRSMSAQGSQNNIYRVVTNTGRVIAAYLNGKELDMNEPYNTHKEPVNTDLIAQVPVIVDQPKVKLDWAVSDDSNKHLYGATLQRASLHLTGALVLTLDCGDEITFDAEKLQAVIARAMQ